MAENGNGTGFRLWQVLVGQIPWVLTIVALGGWYTAKVDARLGAMELRQAALAAAVARIEARQEQDQIQKLDDMQAELKRLRGAINAK